MAGVKMMTWPGRVPGAVQQFKRRMNISKKGKGKKDMRRNKIDEEVKRGKSVKGVTSN
jgi:hypothetical protein